MRNSALQIRELDPGQDYRAVRQPVGYEHGSGTRRDSRISENLSPGILNSFPNAHPEPPVKRLSFSSPGIVQEMMANEKAQAPTDTKPGAASGQDHMLPGMECRNGKQRYDYADRITVRTEAQPCDPSVVHYVVTGAVGRQKAHTEQEHWQQDPGAWPDYINQRAKSGCGNSPQ